MEQLPIDVLYVEILPRLSLVEIRNLYKAIPSFRRAITDYKDWSLEYKHHFTADPVTDSSTGLEKIFRRLDASLYRWGLLPVSIDTEGDFDDSLQPSLAFTELKTPQKYALNEPVKQFLTTRGVLNLEGKVAEYVNGRLEESKGWPGYVSRLYCGDFEIYCTHEGTVHYLSSNQSSRIALQAKRILHVVFYYDVAEILVADVGLVEWFTYFDTGNLIVRESQFPEPLVTFCAYRAGKEQMFVCISETHKVYLFKKSESQMGARAWKKLDFPCPIRSVSKFDINYEPVKVGSQWTFTSLPYARDQLLGFFALGENGNLFYYDDSHGTIISPYPCLKGIVKVVSKGAALFALSGKGELYFLGDTKIVESGLGESIDGDIIDASSVECMTPAVSVFPGNKSDKPVPDLRKIMSNVDIVKRGNATAIPYLVVPRKVPSPGMVVDVNIYGKEVNVLVLETDKVVHERTKRVTKAIKLQT